MKRRHPSAGGLTLVANQAAIGGGEVMLLAMADVAVSAGLEVDIVGPAGELLDAAAGAGHRVETIAGTTRPSYFQALTTWRPGRDTLTWCVGLLPAAATMARSARIVHLHQVPRTMAQRSLARAARLSAAATYVPSHSLAREIPGSRVLWNWTVPITSAAALPKKQTSLRVGFSGRLNVGKGFPLLCQAIQALNRDSTRAAELVVAGDDRFVAPADRRSVDQAQGLLPGRIHKLGWVSRTTFLGQVDVVVVPAVWPESFGLVAAEAMAAGIPLIVSDAGALPEVVGTEHPWIVPAGDVDSLAQMILTVRDRDNDDPVLAARRRWEQHFSPEAGARRFLRVLDSLGLPVDNTSAEPA
ncbi:MAG: glycosyltransferase family 4 protein [Nostocoides sp.]